jgi:hypothetical protein
MSQKDEIEALVRGYGDWIVQQTLEGRSGLLHQYHVRAARLSWSVGRCADG